MLTPGVTAEALARTLPRGRAFDVPITKAGVEVRDGVPVVVINGEPTYFGCHYLRKYVDLGDKWTDGVKDSVRRFNAQGIHRFESAVMSGWVGVNGFNPNRRRRHCWDLLPLAELLNAIIAADPRAQVVLRIGGHYKMAPEEWKSAHPDELERDHTGKTYSISYASDVGFAALATAFRRLVRYVEGSRFAGHVVGYNVFLQFEGVPESVRTEGAFADYSPAMRNAWRRYLKQKYRNLGSLRRAWSDPAADFQTVAAPSVDEHLGGDPRMIFHDPAKAMKVRDYYQLMDDLIVKRHRQVAAAVKESSGGRKLVGLMGGYSQSAGEPRSIASETGFPELQVHKQHFAGPGYVGRAFQIPQIDFYFAPTDYLNTGMGGAAQILNIPASLKLHGKVGWMEDDQRTHLYNEAVFNPRLNNARESVMVHRRNAAMLYAESGCADWMEQTSNWLLHPELLKNLGRIEKLLQRSALMQDKADAVCILFDEESQAWTKPTVLLDEVLFYHQRNKGLSYSGVPFRFHLLSDLAHANFPKYKFFILPNAWHWTPAKAKLLQEVKRDGNVLLWLYGAGYVGKDSLSAAGLEHATGIKMALDKVSWEHRISITRFDHPITRNLPGDLSFGTSRHYGPIFRVTDGDARELGRTFGFRMCRDVGLAIKEFGKGARGAGPGKRGEGDFASIYCEAPDLPAALLREMARYAGTHVYLETNDVLTAGKDIVMVHSAKGGKRTLKLPASMKVTEVFSGKVYGDGVTRFDFSFDDRGGTVLFRLEPS